MDKSTKPEVLEKWSHIAMKVFPPQTRIAPTSDGDGVICVRWKGENDPDALSERARGIDLRFTPEMIEEYLMADAEQQLKWDMFIENALSERLRGFNPYKDNGAQPRIETWQIKPELSTATA